MIVYNHKLTSSHLNFKNTNKLFKTIDYIRTKLCNFIKHLIILKFRQNKYFLNIRNPLIVEFVFYFVFVVLKNGSNFK